ncbi:hypothetical protein BH18ACI3_BH18ACI3_18760 [soil metagenome]
MLEKIRKKGKDWSASFALATATLIAYGFSLRNDAYASGTLALQSTFISFFSFSPQQNRFDLVIAPNISVQS